MTRKNHLTLAFILTAIVLSVFADDKGLTPPVAPKRPKVIQMHGEAFTDNYFWMREKSDPAVLQYLNAENAYTDRMLAHTKGTQQKLYDEMLSRIQETDLSVPYRKGDYYYYSRTEKGKQYAIFCRKEKSLDAPEEIMLDLNQLAFGKKFMGIGAFAVSDDGKLLAYSTDETGFRVYNLAIKDLISGKLLADHAENVSSVFWAADNKTLFYTTKDDAKKPYRLYRHILGEKDSDLLYEEKDQRFSVYGYRSRSQQYMFVALGSLTSTELRYLPADHPMDSWKTLLERKPEREADIDHHGDTFLIRINDTGRNFRLVSVPVNSPEEKNWKELIPHRKDVMLESADAFADFYALRERSEGLSRIRIVNFSNDESFNIDFPDPVYSAFLGANAEFNTDLVRYGYESMTTPYTVYDYDVQSRKSTLLKRQPVLGNYDPQNYVSERVFATAKDGTKVPISIVYKKGFQKDGKAPLLLHGYGAYGANYDVEFNSNSLSLLDRGFAEAIAHIRGGGEMGTPWHDQGRMMNKMNTFTDFIACAEYLVDSHYTSKERLAIEGGSAGGLLMGAVTNMRPDLFRVVINRVPFVDVINTMSDASIPLTAAEFEEWGNSNIKEQYFYMKQYCPYTNIAARDYPAILVTTSWNDSQVMYWEPSKYIAKLRSLKTDKNPLIFKINMAGGHGGSSGRYDKLHETALMYAFILDQVGVK
jgi:oligopeptidase B